MNLNIQKHEGIKEQKNWIFQKILNLLRPIEMNKFTNDDINDIQSLIDSITNAKREWMEASDDFNYVVDKEMVDYLSYKIKAYEARYQYLIKIAKEKGIKYDASLIRNKN